MMDQHITDEFYKPWEETLHPDKTYIVLSAPPSSEEMCEVD